MGLTTWFHAVTGWMRRAAAAASANGMTDEVIRDAYWLAQKAAQQYETNETMRAFVIAQLTSRGVPESIARLALESAVQILKLEQPKA